MAIDFPSHYDSIKCRLNTFLSVAKVPGLSGRWARSEVKTTSLSGPFLFIEAKNETISEN